MKTFLISFLALLAAQLNAAAGAQLGEKLWEFPCGGGNSSPALGLGGIVYFGSQDNKVYALNGTSGQKLWEFTTGAWTDSAPAVGTDGTVYIGSEDNTVYAIDGATGQKKWEYLIGDWVTPPAVAADGTLYLGSYDRKVYALNGATGEKLWDFLTGDEVVSSPALGPDGTVYVGSFDDKLYALDATSGQKLWDFPTGGDVRSSPAIGTNGTVYVGSDDKKLYALNGTTGQKLWEFATDGSVGSPAIGPDGTIYVGSTDNKVYAINGRTGQKRWEFVTGDSVYSSPAIGADGTIYIGSNDRKLYALNGATGEKLWEFTTGNIIVSSPTIGANGTVYFESRDKIFYAVSGSSGLAQSPWPKFRGDPRNTGIANAQLVHIPPVQFISERVLVTRLAGTGEAGYGNGTGTNAQFNFPNGGFVDLAGNIFIADSYNHRIRKISPQGLVSTVAGSGDAGYADGPAATSQFTYPLGVCVDLVGNVFVADAGNNRIRKVSTDGQVSTVAGSGVAGYRDAVGLEAWLNYPNDLVVDAAGNLFVTEFNNHTVRLITSDRSVSTWVGNGSAGSVNGPRATAQLNQPGGIARDLNGNLYVTEWGGQRVRKIATDGQVTTVAGTGVAGYLDGAGLRAQFRNPDGVAVDQRGNLYIADSGNQVLRRIRPNHVVETVAGTGVAGILDGNGSQAQFSSPSGVGLDNQDNLYVADSGNHSMRKIVILNPVVISPEVVKRRLPEGYALGCAVPVELDANPPAPTTTYAVQDQPPAGWDVTSISEGGKFDAATGLVTFGPFFDGEPRTLSYAVVAPSNENALRHFAGLFTMNGEQSPIGGDTQLAPLPYQPTLHYRLIWNSTLTESCPACGRPPSSYPLRGSVELQYFSFIGGTTWRFSDIQMETSNAAPPNYRITGSGTWSDSGQFCFPLCYATLNLSLQVDDGTTNRSCGFYQRSIGSIPQDQVLHLGAPQDNGTPSQTFSISLALAPIQDLWFSIRHGLTSSLTNMESARVENGDVLSDSGRVVKRNGDLLRPFGITPDLAQGYNIDALSVAPGGEMTFSLAEDVVSATAGRLHHGDLLSDRGRIVKSNPQLLQAFSPMSPVEDAGLDGVEIPSESLTLFSITTNVFSEKLGVMLTSGDLLSDQGSVLFSNQQLLSAFQPNPKDQNYGLAAFHVWYSPMAAVSEVWFCTEQGFDSALGPIRAGDLLSTAGYIVYRNLDLLARFQPLEDMPDFGLDGLFLVQEPRLGNPVAARLTGTLQPSGFLLQWDTTGRVFQVHRAVTVNGPYMPVSPIVPDLEWLDAAPPGAATSAFYRLRLW